MRATSLRPPRARPRHRVIWVLAPLSSTKTKLVKGSTANCSCHRALFSATSGRFCSAATRVFFIPPAQLPKPQIDRGSSEGPVHAGAQLGQRGVGSIRQQLLQPLFALLGQQRATPAQMRLRLQRTALPKLLAHPAHRRHAKTEKLSNLASALAPFIELNNPLAHGDRYGSHSHTLCHTIAFQSSYIIYGNALILKHKVYMDAQHNEYWSAGERANVEAARNAGVNMAFFSGNSVFWKTRWENSIDGTNTPYRTLVVYKETLAGARIDPLAP